MSAGAGGSAATGNSGVAGPGVAWATGGTKSMLGGYPDPFATAPGTACKVYPSQTLGPCYAQMPMMRDDLSDGLGGLPVRLSLMVVRANGCMPVPNATVDIWHAGSGGFYSAYAMGTICNPGSENVQTKTFGRGVQTTDANGKVNFSTVFPGWYNGRSIHIHFTLRVNGQEYVTSQLYFEDKLDDEILAQGDYKARGTRDTTNATDMTFLSGGATADEVLLSIAKRPDGVLHAWKVLSIG
jgi:protocatechuate 3,4-dioxygenase beta subunit